MKLIIFIVGFLLSTAFSFSFPEKLERCHRKDPELDKCLKSTIQNAFRLYGEKGIPAFNLGPADPLAVSKLEIGAGAQAVNLVQKYSDVKLHGLSKGTVEAAHFDEGKKILTFSMVVPLIEHKAKYNIDGKVLVLPVYGKGDAVIQLFDVTFGHTLSFEEISKDGKSYFKVKSYKLTVVPKSAHYNFENLFNGDKQLADNILKTINDNWKDIYDDVKSELETSYAEVFKNTASRLFDAIPLDDFF